VRVFKGISGARHRSRPSHRIIAVPTVKEWGRDGGEGGGEKRGEWMTSKGRKVISEVISEYERENGKRLGCVCRVPVIDGSRIAI